MMRSAAILAAAAFAALAVPPARAVVPADLLKDYEAAARSQGSSFAGFSAERGSRLFRTAPGGDWSCASCHTPNPAAPGKHAKTGKAIAPLAPAANAERFTSVATAEKWFKRNCNDVFKRECSAQEKADFMAYLISLRR